MQVLEKIGLKILKMKNTVGCDDDYVVVVCELCGEALKLWGNKKKMDRVLAGDWRFVVSKKKQNGHCAK